jgi:hypothetical protein
MRALNTYEKILEIDPNDEDAKIEAEKLRDLV